MRKVTVVLLSVILVASFLALVIYGLRYSRGKPVVIAEPERAILEALFIDRDIDLTKGVSKDKWDDVPSIQVELMYQVMILPWGKSLVSPITVKAFHNKRDVYFYIRWKDDTADGSTGMTEFSDACAIMFPLDEETQPSTIMMGFLSRTDIWQWKASQDEEYWSKESPKTEAYVDFHYPFEEKETLVVSKTVPKSAVSNLIAKMPGTITFKETQNIQGRGLWDENAWHVVFKRSLNQTASELDAVFRPGEKKLIAFAVWNGANGDRGGRKSISNWVELRIKS